MRTRAHRLVASILLTVVGCGDDDGASTGSGGGGTASATATSSTGPSGSGAGGDGAASGVGAGPGTTTASGGGGSEPAGTGSGGGAGGAGDPGPDVDTSDPQLYANVFQPDEADPAAASVIGDELAYLDTRATPRGLLVVFLHGAGDPSGGTCGSSAHSEMLAALGFHVFDPCYSSSYGVGNCGDDIEGCRLEAFEGVDHHDYVDISRPDSIEGRIVAGLAHAQALNPEGDWTYFLEGDQPRWSRIVISGISHGASTSGVIGLHRAVRRVVMLSGPLDSGQAWLEKPPLTPIEAYWGFTAVDDEQHAGHLEAFAALGLPGEPTSVDGAAPPYGGSHRLESSAPGNAHGATQAGSGSPQTDGAYLYQPVWETMYTTGL